MSGPSGRLTPVVRVAPAKLNLTLAVIGRRPDGFHDLHSVFVPLALCDRLSLVASAGAADTLHVTGFPVGGPIDGADNLVLRALGATRRAVGGGWAGGPGPAPAIAARLDKRIPVAAGLGGGSSDAAAALDGALEVWGAELDGQSRLSVAAGLGSDVPFFAAGGPALVEGRGERVTPLLGLRGAPGILLVTPPVAVSTPDVFAAFAAIRGTGDGSVRLSSAHLASELGGGLGVTDLVARAGVMAAANDLLPAVALVMPELVPFRRALSRLLQRPIGLSGSGPTLWVVYPSSSDAAQAAETIKAAVADGSLTSPGDGAPFVAATTIASPTLMRGSSPGADPAAGQPRRIDQ